VDNGPELPWHDLSAWLTLVPWIHSGRAIEFFAASPGTTACQPHASTHRHLFLLGSIATPLWCQSLMLPLFAAALEPELSHLKGILFTSAETAGFFSSRSTLRVTMATSVDSGGTAVVCCFPESSRGNSKSLIDLSNVSWDQVLSGRGSQCSKAETLRFHLGELELMLRAWDDRLKRLNGHEEYYLCQYFQI
jgi:hypothetical protein